MTDQSTTFFCFGPHLQTLIRSGTPRLNEGDTLVPAEAASTITIAEKATIIVTPPWLWMDPMETGMPEEDLRCVTESWESFARWCLQMASLKEMRLTVLPRCGLGHSFETLLCAYHQAAAPTATSLWSRLLHVTNHSPEDSENFNVWDWLSTLETEQRLRAESAEVALKQVLEAQNQAALAKQELDKSSQALRDAQAESDLLLAQLHQVQEELERYYLLTKDYEQLKQSAQHLENEIRSSKAAQEKLQTELQAEKKLLSDITAKLETAQKAELDQRNKLSADLKSEQAAKTESQTECKKLRQDLDRNTQNLREAQAESDLLLAQLHQVQEELERYYLLTKDYEQHSTRAAQALKAARLQIQKNWIAAGLQLN